MSVSLIRRRAPLSVKPPAASILKSSLSSMAKKVTEVGASYPVYHVSWPQTETSAEVRRGKAPKSMQMTNRVIRLAKRDKIVDFLKFERLQAILKALPA